MTVKVTGPSLAEQLAAAHRAALATAAREMGPQIIGAIRADDRGRFRSFSQRRAARIGWRLRGDGALVVSDRSRMALIHETGGVVVPGRGRYLLIPFKDAAYHGGSQDRKRAVDLKVGSFVVKSGGKLILMRQKADMSAKRAKRLHRQGGYGAREMVSAYPVGILVPRVVLRPRTRFMDTARGQAQRYYRAVQRQLDALGRRH